MGIWSIFVPSISDIIDTEIITSLQEIGKKSTSFYIRQAIPNAILTILPKTEYNEYLYNLCVSLPEKNQQVSSNQLHFDLQQILTLSENIIASSHGKCFSPYCIHL